ncbi:MAG TPA: signal peptidase II [Candidatus Enterenecus stercoripullorum]|nr:signal peptidase II [Candidatus Enterenecus stercoripullorum]
MLYIILFAVLVVIDQVMKFLVRANIPLGESIPFIPHVMDLTYVQNTGAAFSILREHTWLLTLVSAVMVVVIALLVARRFLTGRLGLLSATLVLAGGVGNLIDRAVLGYVTDMFQTTFMDFAVFNVADSCLTIGVILLVIYALFFYDKLHKKEAAEDHGTDLPADRS